MNLMSSSSSDIKRLNNMRKLSVQVLNKMSEDEVVLVTGGTGLIGDIDFRKFSLEVCLDFKFIYRFCAVMCREK